MRQASAVTAGISLVAALLFGGVSAALVGTNRATVNPTTSASGPTTEVASGKDTTGWD